MLRLNVRFNIKFRYPTVTSFSLKHHMLTIYLHDFRLSRNFDSIILYHSELPTFFTETTQGYELSGVRDFQFSQNRHVK